MTKEKIGLAITGRGTIGRVLDMLAMELPLVIVLGGREAVSTAS